MHIKMEGRNINEKILLLTYQINNQNLSKCNVSLKTVKFLSYQNQKFKINFAGFFEYTIFGLLSYLQIF